MSALSELLATAIPADWTTNQVVDEIAKANYDIKRNTVWTYRTGRHTVVRREVLEAFAAAFPVLKLRDLEAAGALPADLGDWVPPSEVNALNAKEREAVEVIIRSMARARGLERQTRRRTKPSEDRPTVADLRPLRSAAEPERQDKGQREGDENGGDNT